MCWPATVGKPPGPAHAGLQSPKAPFQAIGTGRYVRGATVDPHLAPPFQEVLHREIGVSQKTAWHMLQRIRKAVDDSDEDNGPFDGPVEVDET